MSIPTDPPLSRRAARRAEVSSQEAQPEGFAQPIERRPRSATPVSVPSSAPTDVAYRTQVRPRVPHYDSPPAVHEVIEHGSPPALVEPAPPVAPPVAPAPGSAQMRRRDFRPPAEPVADPSAAGFAPAAFDTALEYHTQLTPRPDARPAPPATDTTTGSVGAPPLHVIGPGAVVAPPVVAEPAREQTLSRRELRALREAAGLPAEPGEAELAPPPAVAAEIVVPAVVVPAVVAPAPVAPETVVPAPVAAPPEIVIAADPQPLVQPDAVPRMPSAVISSPPPGSAPTGSHWSVGIHDEDDPFENTFSREVGSAVSMTNTNALVLPEMPLGSLSGPVSGTGEIIITGMIDLPRAVSSTGTVPTVHESPDIDDLFDPGDLAAGPADAAPVSALRAVSSHTGTSGIMTPGRRPAGNTITTVLVASTVVMAVVAIGLFVLAAVNGLF